MLFVRELTFSPQKYFCCRMHWLLCSPFLELYVYTIVEQDQKDNVLEILDEITVEHLRVC